MATPISLAYRSRSVWSARSQSRVAGRLARMRPDPLVAGAELGPDRHRHARDALLGLHRVGVDEEDHGGDEPECRLGIAGGALGHRLDAVPRLGRFDRRQDRPELSVATLGVGGQAVVALGQLGEDIGPHDRDRLAHVARRDARHRRRDLAQRPDQVQPDRGPAQDPDDDGDGEHEQQEARPDVGIDRAGHDEQEAEDAERDERGGQQRRASAASGTTACAPRVAAGSAGPVIGRGRRGSRQRMRRRGRPGWRPAGSRCRGRSAGGADGWDRPRASAAGAAS